MHKALLSAVPITCVTMLIALCSPSMTHALPPEQVSCSETEVQITTPLIEPAPQATVWTVLPTVRVDIPRPLNSGEQCKVTLSTEIATADPYPQLLALAYALVREDTPPDPTACQFIPGPVLFRVESGGSGGPQDAPGFDQTTTVVSVLSEKQIGGTDTNTDIVPCLAIFQSGRQPPPQARLRRHCLLVECGTR